jgi:hypothetical protein
MNTSPLSINHGKAASDEHTLVLQEVTHPRSTGENELSDILDDLGLLLRRQRLEPFRQSDFACSRNSSISLSASESIKHTLT